MERTCGKTNIMLHLLITSFQLVGIEDPAALWFLRCYELMTYEILGLQVLRDSHCLLRAELEVSRRFRMRVRR